MHAKCFFFREIYIWAQKQVCNQKTINFFKPENWVLFMKECIYYRFYMLKPYKQFFPTEKQNYVFDCQIAFYLNYN